MAARHAVLILCLIAGPACAATRTVTTTSDDASDTGSLRHWIINADPGDTIAFDLPAYPAVIQLTQQASDSALNITKSMTIVGPGADKLTIEAYADVDQNVDTVFAIYQPPAPTADIEVSISGLKIDNAATAIFCNAYALGTDFKMRVDVSDAVLTPKFESLELDNGIVATVTRVTASGGQDTAVYAVSDPAGAQSVVTISDSTIANNNGGIYNSGSNVTLVNSTLAANGFADDTTNFYSQISGEQNATTTLVFTTVVGSDAAATPGLFAIDPSAAFALKNSLVAGHPGGNCSATGISSSDYNLSDDATCAFGGTHDHNDTPAGLSAKGLASNGGPTPTIALSPGSAALNAIPLANCTDAADNPVTSDQRGAARPDGSGCDIGAYESDTIFAGSFD